MIISVSQIRTFMRCPRLWWFSIVNPLKPDYYNRHLTFGYELHDLVASWLRTGRIKETSDQVRSLLEEAIQQGVIARRDNLEPEHSFEEDIDGVRIRGIIDALVMDDKYCQIQDHKSCKTPRYTLTSDKLKHDLQMMVYAKIMIVRNKKLSYVDLRHNYFCLPMDRTWSVTAKVERAEIDDYWERNVAPAIAKMYELASMTAERGLSIADLKLIENNAPSSCLMYGGCKFINTCPEYRQASE